jgi:hypothetical protein
MHVVTILHYWLMVMLRIQVWMVQMTNDEVAHMDREYMYLSLQKDTLPPIDTHETDQRYEGLNMRACVHIQPTSVSLSSNCAFNNRINSVRRLHLR